MMQSEKRACASSFVRILQYIAGPLLGSMMAEMSGYSKEKVEELTKLGLLVRDPRLAAPR
jgi:hypothetical protein